MFGELEKAIFGPDKDKWRIRGSKTPKPPEMPLKQGKTSQHHNWPRYTDCPQIGPKSAIKLGKRRQKDKWYLFRAPAPPPPQLLEQSPPLSPIKPTTPTCLGLLIPFPFILKNPTRRPPSLQVSECLRRSLAGTCRTSPQTKHAYCAAGAKAYL